MQNLLKNLTTVTLIDPESQQSYTVYVNNDDAVRCEEDPSFAQSLLFHAKSTATDTNETSANIAMSNNYDHEETQKRKRFRFSETDRIKCIRELYGILAEDDFQTEKDVWSRLHDTVMYDNPNRFNTCSVRLLKDHMLEQVAKFCKYDSKEAIESGKERLQTPWGDCMRQLMTVWDNYKKIEATNKVGRPRSANSTQLKEDVELAKKIRDTAMESIKRSSLTEEETYDVEVGDNMAEHSGSSTPTTSRCVTTSATKKRRVKAKENIPNLFVYLAEKARLENEQKQKALQFKQQQHADQIRMQEESLKFKKAKLEYDKERWEREAQEKIADRERNNLIIKLLQSVISKNE